MEIRLQKFLAQCGIASRRNSEKLILEGLVQINGKIEKELGIKIDPEKDNIFFKGKKLTAPKCPKLVYILNKPKNCITSLKDEKNRDIISKYFPKLDCPLFPVGRLDYDAEGLIFITNDGDFAQQISHPKYKFKKSYFVKIDKILDEKELKILNKKMFIEEKIYQAKVIPLRQTSKKSWVKVDLYQGLNLQIKKMFWHLKIQVLKIKRFQIGNIHLADLKSGQYRLLKKEEVKKLLDNKPTNQRI